MKIAVIGAGYVGLTAAYELAKNGHEVSVFEQQSLPGGMALVHKEPSWRWSVEYHYHHWFTNDHDALSLAKELGIPVQRLLPKTDTYMNGKLAQLDGVASLLRFSHLTILERVRLGVGLGLLRVIPIHRFPDLPALPVLHHILGFHSTNTLWEPLFRGKFHSFADAVSIRWFMARIHKRTRALCYPIGGFSAFTAALCSHCESLGVHMHFNTSVQKITSTKRGGTIVVSNKRYQFDRVLCTVPHPVFVKCAPTLPASYTAKLFSTQHLHALTLTLIMDKRFSNNSYWINMNDLSCPFLVVVEHTHMISRKHYGGDTIVYVGSYREPSDPVLNYTKRRLLNLYHPYLEKLSPGYRRHIKKTILSFAPFAQPIMDVGYNQRVPSFQTPHRHVYLANIDMIYPWDRGTNYAIALGKRVALCIMESHESAPST